MPEGTMRVIGLDVPAETIAAAGADGDGGEVRALGTIPNTPEAVAKLLRKQGAAATPRVCYEAGPCGDVLHRQVTERGIACPVVAPSLVPRPEGTRPGDNVKTDRRDARKLARLHRAGERTAVWAPDAAHEALRDLTRAREDAQEEVQRVRALGAASCCAKGFAHPPGSSRARCATATGWRT